MGICIFGDSVAKGVIYDEAKEKYIFSKNGFVDRFAELITSPVKNFAKFGCTITKAAEIINKHEGELGNYKFTVLEFGGNDCNFNWSEVSENPSYPHLPMVPIDEFEKTYECIIEKVIAGGSRPILLSLPPIDSERFFEWVSKGLNKDNILKFLNDVNFIYRWHERYNLCAFDLAQKYGIPFVDIRKAFLEVKNYRSLLCIDGMHPNEKGHALIFKSVTEVLPSFK